MIKALTFIFICDILTTYKNKKGIKMKELKKEFFIKALIDVHDYSYNDGDLDFINSYKRDSIIKASNTNEAIKDFFSNDLYFSVDLEKLEFDEENKCFVYDVLSDADNNEVLENSNLFKEWKKGKIDLYNSYIQFYIYELNLITKLKQKR